MLAKALAVFSYSINFVRLYARTYFVMCVHSVLCSQCFCIYIASHDVCFHIFECSESDVRIILRHVIPILCRPCVCVCVAKNYTFLLTRIQIMFCSRFIYLFHISNYVSICWRIGLGNIVHTTYLLM